MKKLMTGLAVVALALGLAISVKAEEKEIKGELGCAHCAFSAGKTCAVGVKTSDGKVYTVTLKDKKAQDQLMKDRESKGGKTIVVKGEVHGTEIAASSTKIQD